MLSKNNIKYIRSLKLKKFRQKYNKFVVEGNKIALEMIQSGSVTIENIYALSSWVKTNEHLLKFHNDKLRLVSEKELQKISFLKTPNEVLIVAEAFDNQVDEATVLNGVSLFLDGIQDPGNMGTIIRTADWFGIESIFCSSNCVSLYNSKVLQSTMGAFLRVKTLHYTLPELLEQVGDLPVFGAAMNGENIFSINKPENGIIVIGNEGKGISTELNSSINKWIHIPSGNSTGAESLNAAVATGIICATLLSDRLTT